MKLHTWIISLIQCHVLGLFIGQYLKTRKLKIVLTWITWGLDLGSNEVIFEFYEDLAPIIKV
jgi:hypothetical protein